MHPSHPNPFRCKKCFRLGHIACRCSDKKCCRNCAKSHPPDIPCSTRCVNCSSPSHTSDSDTCPSLLTMKAIIKISVTQNITIAEARAQHNRLYSKVTLGSSRPPLSTAPQPEITNNLSIQINKLQEEINEISSTTIAGLKSSINSLARILEKTKPKSTPSTSGSIP